MGYWLKQWFIYMDLGICVDGVVADVEELSDLGFGKLLDDAFA
jgi:hypothetical protein